VGSGGRAPRREHRDGGTTWHREPGLIRLTTCRRFRQRR
jgi:hypothetical protein